MLHRCIYAFEYSVIYTVYYIMGFKKKVLSFLFQVNCKWFCNSLLFKSLKILLSTVQGCTIRTQCHGKGKNDSFFKH